MMPQPPRQTPFTLEAQPKTDIFASPPSTYIFNAPTSCITTRAAEFHSATITFTYPWKYQFDQAGLLIAACHPSLQPNAEDPGDGATHPDWIKAGVEVFEGEPLASLVVRQKHRWCDWSVSPYQVDENAPKQVAMSIKAVRDKHALWIYECHGGDRRRLLRKVNGFFDEENSETVLVGAYAARPDPFDEAAGSALEVQVDDLNVHALDVQTSG